MTCADFLAGANPQNDNPKALLLSLNRLFGLLPRPQRQQFVELARKALLINFSPGSRGFDSTRFPTEDFVVGCCSGTDGAVSAAGACAKSRFTIFRRADCWETMPRRI
jgi:hypothetical protein